MDERKIRNALFGISCEADTKPLWEVFPPYTLAPGFDASPDLVATLKDCYAPEAVRLRSMFLTTADRLTEKAVKGGEWISINDASGIIGRVGLGAELGPCA